MNPLLERGNTRLAPLDTVEPDAFWVNGWLMLPRQAEKYQKKDPLYSRPKMEAHIESLLSQCRKEARKEALLEAADKFTGKEYYGASVQFELRRMADSVGIQQ